MQKVCFRPHNNFSWTDGAVINIVTGLHKFDCGVRSKERYGNVWRLLFFLSFYKAVHFQDNTDISQHEWR